MTLEGCVVRVCDIIAYIGKDIEDAITLGIIKKDEIPKNITNVLGTTNREIINTIVKDIIVNSKDKPYIEMSKEIYEALVGLKKFNYENIYSKANTKDEIAGYENMFRSLFNKYKNDVENKEKDSTIWQTFLHSMSNEYLDSTSSSRKVIDFIAGMTDDYIKKCYLKDIENVK
jgi:dGTPase